MKRKASRFLSLLMVFAMLCGMIPAAMAADYYVDNYGIEWYDECAESYNGKHDPVYYDCNGRYEIYYCDNGSCDDEGTLEHDWVYDWYDDEYHEVWCDNEECDYYEEEYEEHDFDRDGYCIYCEADDNYGDCYIDEVEQYDDLESDDDYYYENEDVELSVEVWLCDENDDYIDADDAGVYFYYDWEGDLWVDDESDDPDDYYDEDTYSDKSSAYLDTTLEECYVECTVYIYDENDDYDYDDPIDYYTVEWELYCDDYAGGDIVVEATVDSDTEGYWLDEEDDEGNTSIEDQIFDEIADIDSDYELEYVEFETVEVSNKGYLDASTRRDYYYYNAYDVTDSDYLLSEVVFYPEEGFEGEVSFDFTAYYYDDYDSSYDYTDLKYLDGTIVFDVINGESTGMDILYTAESGEEVLLDEEDFEDFWYEEYPKGTLEYVKFTKVSTGYLYDNYAGGSKKWTDVEGTTKCYLDPTSKQIGLDDLTYVPGKNTVSATIEFTARGTTKSSGSSKDDVSGTITILYVDGDIDPIEYEVEDDVVTLDATDFTALYKEVMDVKSAGTLQIQFMEVPENGTLYVNYSVSKSGKVSGTKLTASNIESYEFSTSTSANRSIEDVTYVHDSSASEGDTIRFACYSSNQLKFIGTINFNAAAPVVISLNCTAKGGLFKTTDFFNSANSALMKANYILFGTPTSGTLYKNSANGIGTKVTVSDKFTSYTNTAYGYYSLNELAFMPSAIGQAEIPFVGVLSTGAYVNGTVKITVSAAAFTDVSANAYYYDAVQWAVLNQVTTGTNDGTTFSPNMTCDRGQVVTFLWRSKGCPEPKTTTNPFTDVKSTDYFYKAVLWAVEQGITTGTGGNSFSPYQTCTSGEVVTFLWRANGKPATAHIGTQFYAEAVAWANANSLLSGTGKAFVATANCPRADIVTYMYRAAK